MAEWEVKRNDYPQYYQKQSKCFDVDTTYWVRPGAVSPAIEPTTNEYLLIMRYRCQNNPKEIGSLPLAEYFFPGCRELSGPELEWLESFKTLSKDANIFSRVKQKNSLKNSSVRLLQQMMD